MITAKVHHWVHGRQGTPIPSHLGRSRAPRAPGRAAARQRWQAVERLGTARSWDLLRASAGRHLGDGATKIFCSWFHPMPKDKEYQSQWASSNLGWNRTK